MNRAVLNLLVVFGLLGLSGYLVSGTTIVAARCRNGIVLASDTQSSGNSVVISSRTVRKVFLLSKSTVLCAASDNPQGMTDFQQLYSELSSTIMNHKNAFDTTLSTTSIAKVARQLINQKYSRAHIVIAGWDSVSPVDETRSAGDDYLLCEILPGGTRIDQSTAVAGTGATLIASLLEDSLHSSNSDENGSQDVSKDNLRTVFDYSPLSVEQAIPKLKRCLSLAGKLDPQTGGSKFHMWVLSKPAGKVKASSSGSDHRLVPVTADYVSRALG